MKTVIAWVEYEKHDSVQISNCEYASFGEDGAEFETVKQFLDAIRKLGKTAGYDVYIRNVVIG